MTRRFPSITNYHPIVYCAVQRVKYKIIKEETFKGEQEEALSSSQSKPSTFKN